MSTGKDLKVQGLQNRFEHSRTTAVPHARSYIYRTLPDEYRDPNRWAHCDTSSLEDAALVRFERFQRAITGYLRHGKAAPGEPFEHGPR